jgi:6-hydroxycyclohex-1-ene-1-carbonyl-CoA dehydrogenase
MATIRSWQMVAPGEPMQLVERDMPGLGEGEALVRVAGCGVCHTDLGFWAEGVRTNKQPPLTLGHEISGIVEDAAPAFQNLIGKGVIIPAVLPCGECDLCRKGRGSICRRQVMPGNDIDGGFASHVVVPARDLCVLELSTETEPLGNSAATLVELSVVADAVTTPYQAVLRSEVAEGDVAIFVGVGGVGGFGVQIARALGATVVAVDIDAKRLERMAEHGAELTLNASELDRKEIRNTIREFVRASGLSPYEWKIFETSGTAAGQTLAFSLLTHGATLSVVGFTMEPVNIRLSNLMAFDARAVGNWGCLPEHYPKVVDMVRRGDIHIAPFVQTFPMSQINDVFERVQRHEIGLRPILVPDFS